MAVSVPWFGSGLGHVNHHKYLPYLNSWAFVFLTCLGSLFVSTVLLNVSSVSDLSMAMLFSRGNSQSRLSSPLESVLGRF